jgi:hypothetical protein
VIPIWTLKIGTVAVTLASTAGFWHYVTGHVHPVTAALKPKVAEPAVDTVTRSDTGWDMADPARPTPPPAIVRTVVVQGPQQQIQSSAALGATWVANRTGQKPVANTRQS